MRQRKIRRRRLLDPKPCNVKRGQNEEGENRCNEQPTQAIGPQNTVGAIGINPSTVEIAVSMIGRKRDRVTSTTASQICGL